MNSPRQFFLEGAEYESSLEVAGRLVNLHERLPSNPFCSRGGKYTICEYDWVPSPEFGEVFEALAAEFSDASITVLALPDDMAEADWDPRFSAYSVPAAHVRRMHVKLMAYEPSTYLGELRVWASGFVAYGSSMRWALRAIRSLDVAVIWSDVDGWASQFDFFMDARSALDSLIRPLFPRDPLSRDWEERFVESFQGEARDGPQGGAE